MVRVERHLGRRPARGLVGDGPDQQQRPDRQQRDEDGEQVERAQPPGATGQGGPAATAGGPPGGGPGGGRGGGRRGRSGGRGGSVIAAPSCTVGAARTRTRRIGGGLEHEQQHRAARSCVPRRASADSGRSMRQARVVRSSALAWSRPEVASSTAATVPSAGDGRTTYSMPRGASASTTSAVGAETRAHLLGEVGVLVGEGEHLVLAQGGAVPAQDAVGDALGHRPRTTSTPCSVAEQRALLHVRPGRPPAPHGSSASSSGLTSHQHEAAERHDGRHDGERAGQHRAATGGGAARRAAGSGRRRRPARWRPRPAPGG